MSKITSNPSRLLRKCVRPKKAGDICSIPMMGFTNSQTDSNTNNLTNTGPSVRSEQKLAVEKNLKTQINSPKVIENNLPAVRKVVTNFNFYSSFSFICTVGICMIYFLIGSICFYYFFFYFYFYFLFPLLFYLFS